MAYDLDGADLGEVRRRVVDPVLSRVFHDGELDRVDVRFGPPFEGLEAERTENAPRVWVGLTARGEEFAWCVAKAIFEREDALEAARELEGELGDWVVETAFGWGQLRVADGVPPVPPPVWPSDPSGRPVLEVYPDEGVPSPLWVQGVNVSLDELPVSEGLGSGLQEWVAHWEAATGNDESSVWTDVVGDLEPQRRRLVERLREELSTSYAVADPIPLDRLTPAEPPRLL